MTSTDKTMLKVFFIAFLLLKVSRNLDTQIIKQKKPTNKTFVGLPSIYSMKNHRSRTFSYNECYLGIIFKQ